MRFQLLDLNFVTMFRVYHHVHAHIHRHTINTQRIYDARTCTTCSQCTSADYVFLHIFRADEMKVRNEYIGEQSLLYLDTGSLIHG